MLSRLGTGAARVETAADHARGSEWRTRGLLDELLLLGGQVEKAADGPEEVREDRKPDRVVFFRGGHEYRAPARGERPLDAGEVPVRVAEEEVGVGARAHRGDQVRAERPVLDDPPLFVVALVRLVEDVVGDRGEAAEVARLPDREAGDADAVHRGLPRIEFIAPGKVVPGAGGQDLHLVRRTKGSRQSPRMGFRAARDTLTVAVDHDRELHARSFRS